MNSDAFRRVSQAFNGFSLEHRRGGTNWPQPWRAQILPNKGTRQDYRLTAYGPTAELAVDNLDALLTAKREENQSRFAEKGPH